MTQGRYRSKTTASKAGRGATSSKRLTYLPIAGAALISVGAVSGQVYAQDASSSTTLQPIVISGQGDNSATGPDKTIVAKDTATGTKTDTPIIDVPQAVSVVTQKELEKRNVQDIQQALAYTSSVTTDEYGSDDRYDYFRIRGFDETSLGTYRDGLTQRIAAFWTTSRVEPYGLQRVEVLKGSTSSLFGLNAPGGLVNAITKRPTEDFMAEAYTTLGQGHVEMGADVGGPLDPDGVFTYRLTGKYQNADQGYQYTNDDRVYIAPALTISPDAGTSLTFLTDYSKRDSSIARGVPMGSGLSPDVFLGDPSYNHFNTRQTDVGYQFEHELADGVTFRSSGRYSHINLDYKDSYATTFDPTTGEVGQEAFTVDGPGWQYTMDNQLEVDHSFQHADSKFLFGTDYTYNNTHENVMYGDYATTSAYNPTYCGPECVAASLGPYINWRPKQTAVGIYGQEQLTIDDHWIVTLGGRLDHVKSVAEYLDSGTQDDETEVAFTKRAGLSYKFNDQLAVYGNYSESFQPLVAPTANGYTVTSSLKPQLGKQYEVGMKYKPDGFDGLFTLAFFDLSQTNVPVAISDLVQKQVGKVEVKGVEFESKFALADHINATLAYSYWDGEIAENGTDGNVGNRPVNVPKNVASAWLDYTIPGNGARGDITFGGGVRYVGQLYGDEENTISVPGHTVFDAAASYKVTKNLLLQVNATNIFDKKYQATCYTGTCYYGDRRSVLGTLKYTF